VQHPVGGWMRGAVCLEDRDRIIEPQPLRNPHLQSAFPLQFLIDQEIIPAGIVLNRSHAVRGCIVHRQHDRLSSHLVRGWRNMLLNQIQSPALADNPRQLAMGIMVELAARWIRGLPGYPRHCERG
jgi:hypothetical protein